MTPDELAHADLRLAERTARVARFRDLAAAFAPTARE
jgi:hypothetical protein